MAVSTLQSSGEFAALPFRETDATLCIVGSNNMEKNRYRDILPPDATRVLLINGGYINANLIDLGGTPMIACQGPIDRTIEDFLIMLLQYQVPAILMVTPLVEQKKVKCVKYWPDPGQVLRYGNIVVYNIVSNVIHENLVISVLFVATVSPVVGLKPLLVRHLYYSGMPDDGIADLDEVNLVLCLLLSVLTDSRPFVCHCSAGVGRTGIFAAILRCIKTGEPPVTAIHRLRMQRHGMVQNRKQFRLIKEFLKLLV